jgi:hypothetical protein
VVISPQATGNKYSGRSRPSGDKGEARQGNALNRAQVTLGLDPSPDPATESRLLPLFVTRRVCEPVGQCAAAATGSARRLTSALGPLNVWALVQVSVVGLRTAARIEMMTAG